MPALATAGSGGRDLSSNCARRAPQRRTVRRRRWVHVHFVSNPANKAITQQNVNWIEKAEKLDPFKVRVRLRQPFPAALEYLAGPVVIYPNEYYAKVGPKGMSEKPVGSGPYKVVEHQPGRLVRFERNADYFKESPRPQPTIEKLELRLIPDQNTQAGADGQGLD
jgi:peptide/nickel transport system substrate-binding protein